MNDHELFDNLRSLSVPKPDPVAKRRALVRAREALQSSPRQRFSIKVLTVAGLSIAASLMIALTLRQHLDHGPFTHNNSTPGFGLTQQLIYDECRAVFGDQLSALVNYDDNLEVVLTEHLVQAPSRPIIVQICKLGKGCAEVITVSGEPIEIMLDDEIITLDILQSAEDEILISGPDFLWTEAESHGCDDFTIRATLGAHRT